jgi:lipooligosaccharide transport system ATP-binding protein
VKSRIGVCQQENNIDPDLTVLQNLEVFARYFNIPAAEATRRSRELLRFMALDHRENARALDLSGGMIRRLVMARALLNRPELLILDEPTTGLDPQSRHQVWERLEELRADGLSILLTTHYMDEAARLCDRLIIVDQGRLLVEGKPAELVRRHVGRHVLEVADPAEGLPAFLRERGAVFENLGHRLIVDVEDGTSLYREIDGRFCNGGCVMRMATLEDVFLRLTGRELRDGR